MINLHGIGFAEDEVQVVVIEGEPIWAMNHKGLHRLCESFRAAARTTGASEADTKAAVARICLPSDDDLWVDEAAS